MFGTRFRFIIVVWCENIGDGGNCEAGDGDNEGDSNDDRDELDMAACDGISGESKSGSSESYGSVSGGDGGECEAVVDGGVDVGVGIGSGI